MDTAELNQRALAFLKEEKIKEFNELRYKNPDWSPDLSETDFRGAHIEYALGLPKF